MLAGTWEVQVDEAGRLTVPARLRAEVGDEVCVTTAFPPHRYLRLFAADKFEEHIRTVFPVPLLDPVQETLKRLILGNAFTRKFDSAGRILLPKELLEAAGIDGPAKVVGMDECAEIWSAQAHLEWSLAARSPEMMLRTMEALQGLGRLQEQRWRDAG